VDIRLGRAALTLRTEPGISKELRRVAAGRPLLIGCFTSVVRGWRIGDLTVDFDVAHLDPSYVEVSAVHDVPVAVDRRLLGLLRRGATLCRRPRLSGHGFTILLDHPEDWLDFLDGRPIGATAG
jgi:hypothetical protein